MALNAKQQAFIDEYLKCWNASEAARRAGYSEKTAYSQGGRLLKHVEVATAIQERIDERSMSADEVLIRLAEQARGIDSQYFRIGTVFIPDGEDGEAQQVAGVDFKSLIEDGKGHLIKSLGYSKDGDLTKVEFYDAQSALVHIGRHHKLFTDKLDVEAHIECELTGDEIREGKARAAGVEETILDDDDDDTDNAES